MVYHEKRLCSYSARTVIELFTYFQQIWVRVWLTSSGGGGELNECQSLVNIISKCTEVE